MRIKVNKKIISDKDSLDKKIAKSVEPIMWVVLVITFVVFLVYAL